MTQKDIYINLSLKDNDNKLMSNSWHGLMYTSCLERTQTFRLLKFNDVGDTLSTQSVSRSSTVR